MTDPSNNPTATLPYVTQLSQQPDEEEDDDHNVDPSAAEEPNTTITELPTAAAEIEPNATNTDLPNAADIAFDLIVRDNPHIHPVQHSQMMISVMALLQSNSECCEKIGKLLFKFKRAKAKSIELTKIANSVIQQIRLMLLTNKARLVPHLNPDLVIPIVMPHSSPDTNMSKPIYDCLQCYLTILRSLAHDYDTSTDVNVTVLNPYHYLLRSNVPSPPAHSCKSFKAPSHHSGSGGDPDDPSGDDDDGGGDDDDNEDEEDAALFGPHRADIEAMERSLDIIDFVIHHVSVMRDKKSNKRYFLSQTIRSYANEFYAYQKKKEVRFCEC
jgi:hypothetical protein